MFTQLSRFRFKSTARFAAALFGLLPPVRAQTSPAASPPSALAPVTITATREKALLSETPVSVGLIPADDIRETGPLHPGQLLGRVPGVAVAVTNGEGHTTAIRQPLTTSPVYLFLEDGIPIRATGFFNHNALYEVNVPLAGGIEVIRGPATALYGSDAIGGVVNILTPVPRAERHARISVEHGSFGTSRLLLSGGGALRPGGDVQIDVNATHGDGWRDRTAYDRQSVNLRFDQRLDDDTVVKTIFAASRIEQETGANSALPWAEYRANPTRNHFAIAFREVEAVRLSLEYERQVDRGMVSLVPYFRFNRMELNGTFNLNSDPRLEHTRNVSYGLLAKWRRNFAPARLRVIGGLDLDFSPGRRREDNLLLTRTGSGATTSFTDYRIGTRIYDYAVAFSSASPYVHVEFSPTPALRFTAGLRHDALRYRMENRLATGAVEAEVLGARRLYGQLPDTTRSFRRSSPKLGATLALSRTAHAYASYNFGFRAPSESQLFRAGYEASAAAAVTRAELALGLRPIQARQTELGLRAEQGGVTWNAVVYELRKTDDLVSRRDLTTNVATNVNAGATRHRGVELGAGTKLGPRWRFDTAVSYAKHEYRQWMTTVADFSGREIEAAPRLLANARLTWRPAAGAMLQLEWSRLGAYWLEAGNSAQFGKYAGHELFHLRGAYALTKRVGVFARIMNLGDTRYAESASVSSGTPVFSPGLPRAVYGGVELEW